MQKTTIPWTDYTWNPCTGCDKVSPGCKNCYAEDIADTRFKGTPAFPNGFKFTIHRDRFDKPRALRKPAKIFVNSMSDLFHPRMPLDLIQELFAVMGECPQHTFQILTKRHERLAELAPSLDWHPNIWTGVSVENQAYADLRIAYLRRVPAVVRFLSVEPLIGPLDQNFDCVRGIHWVIVGCESGPRRRPMKIEWAEAVRDQCLEFGIPFFMKQIEVGGKVTEDVHQFPSDLQFRQWPRS
jgi:protein gp37